MHVLRRLLLNLASRRWERQPPEQLRRRLPSPRLDPEGFWAIVDQTRGAHNDHLNRHAQLAAMRVFARRFGTCPIFDFSALESSIWSKQFDEDNVNSRYPKIAEVSRG